MIYKSTETVQTSGFNSKMTSLISKLTIRKKLLIGEQLLMEIAQLRKNAYNNQLQQFMYLCHKRKMSQIWQVNTLWQGLC